MQRFSRSKQCSRKGSLTARKGRSRLSRTRYLANPASLIGIPRLEPVHAGNKISFGSSALTGLAQTLVEIDLADKADWIAAEKTPSIMVEQVLRRYLADRGQSTLAEHFELYLTLSEGIVDSVYSEAEPPAPNSFSLSSIRGRPLPWAWATRSQNLKGPAPAWAKHFTTRCVSPYIAGSVSMTIWTPGNASSK